MISLTELKKGIVSLSLPPKMAMVDKNHTMTLYYLDQISLKYNRKLKKIFDVNSALAINTDFDVDYTIYLLYLNKRDLGKVLELITKEAMVIVVSDEDLSLNLPTVEVGKLSRKANLLYLTQKLLAKSKDKDDDGDHLLSPDLIEEALDYFEDDLDRVVNELDKVKILGLTSVNSWNKPFRALLDCLPPKDQKMRSLKWFSGGDVDTCQVLYNIYIKKLRGLPNSPIEDQGIWARLVKESIWCEACILAGLIGDYVSDYLKLVENSLPGDFKVEYFPPVFFSQVLDHPEWGVDINKIKEENNG